ncbi:hypothetical protein IG631_16069 [Alternaria alternata]|nr:hypothetical protein IG631_16069 [Alternaria alternata]
MPQLDTFRYHYTISHATTYRMYEKEVSKHTGSRWKLRRGKMTPQLQVTMKLCQKSLSASFSSPILPPITETHLVASTNISPTSREYRQEGVVSDRHSRQGRLERHRAGYDGQYSSGKIPRSFSNHCQQHRKDKASLGYEQIQRTAMANFGARHAICEDTIARSPSIAASTPGGSLTSYFIPSQLPPLSKTSPKYPNLALQTPPAIYNSDSFALARILPGSGKIGVLNLASDIEPGGGWRYTLSRTQEEALCYSSTLYATLKPEWYPWPNTGQGSIAGVMSPDVVVFRDTLDNGLAELPVDQRHVVAVMTVAAPCLPAVTEGRKDFVKMEDLENLREKILLVLRMAAGEGVTRLVLGAMGCGAYRCPPRVVAKEMKMALESEEFAGWFESIAFAVYAAGPIGQKNLEVFREVFVSEVM